MAAVYAGALVARPALLEDRSPVRATPGEGTFVAVGTHIDPFDRIVEAADEAIHTGLLPAPGFAQTGVGTYVPRGLDHRAWLTPDELQVQIEQARYIVCHSGSGLIARCLRAGRKPLVMPRLAELGEHVDDHQLQLVRKLAEMDCVVPLDGPITAAHVSAADEPVPSASRSALPAMVDLLREQLGGSGDVPMTPPAAVAA
jgi:UDP-N-acetylglucosamine transferase subunit ALG13